jgi:hypothetical protein
MDAMKKSQEAARIRLEPVRTKMLESKSIMGAAHAWHEAWMSAPDRGTRVALRYMTADYTDLMGRMDVKYNGTAARKLNDFEKAWYQMAAAYGGDRRFAKNPVATVVGVFNTAGGKPDSALPITARGPRTKKSA